MPEPRVIEAHCERGNASNDAVRRVIAAAEYQLESFYPGPFYARSAVDRMFAHGGGVLLRYRPATPTMIPGIARRDGHPFILRQPAVIETIAVGDGPAHFDGIPAKALYARVAEWKGWFVLSSTDLEAVCVAATT